MASTATAAARRPGVDRGAAPTAAASRPGAHLGAGALLRGGLHPTPSSPRGRAPRRPLWPHGGKPRPPASVHPGWERPLPRRTTRALLEGVRAGLLAPHPAGVRPTIVFDIDDTLVWTEARTRTAAGRAGERVGVRASSLAELLRGSSGADRARRQAEFERAYRGDGALLGLDEAIPGALAFVRALDAAGAHVVYVTGRWETMRAETEAQLRRLGFPLAAPGDLLVKPVGEETAAYKRREVRRLRAAGPIAAGFENEPANARVFAEELAGASIFRLTTFAGHDDLAPPPPGVHVISGYAGWDSALGRLLGRARRPRP